MSLFDAFRPFLFLLLLGEIALGSPNNFKDLKKAFRQGEIKREAYLEQLIKLRYEFISNNGHDNNAITNETIAGIDREIKAYPLPPTVNSKTLSLLRIGVWESPHHGYLYRSDYSWTMLPIEENITHGLWEIEGNKYYDWVPIYAPKRDAYTIILLNVHYFVFTDGEHLYCEKKIGKR